MPRDLSVAHLSNSSINTLRRCAYKWKLRYVDRIYEPSSVPQMLGKVFGAAECQSDHTWIEDGAPLDSAQVLDAYSDEFDLAKDEDVAWRGEQPGPAKDQGALALRIYHTQVPGLPAPVDAEREFQIQIEDVLFIGYIDVEREDGAVEDRKLPSKKISQAQADSDPQVDSYLAARRAEGNPADRFVFDAAVKTQNPYVQRVETTRTDEQLDHFLLGVLGAADEIQWRLETDNWSFAASGAWWCSESQCGYWSQCPAGGLLRQRAAQVVLNGNAGAEEASTNE